MIKRAPLKTDTAGKCTRWHVAIWNKETQKKEWHTVHGTLKQAEALERKFKDAQASGVYISREQRLTVKEVFDKWMLHLKANNRRTSTVECYESDITCHILPDLGTHEADKLRKHQLNEHFAGMRAKGATTATVNRVMRSFKALMYFAFDSEIVSRPVMRRVKPLPRVKGEQRVKRDAFTEDEVRRILGAANPSELALIGLLTFGGARPGEMYALDCDVLTLAPLDTATVRIERSWDHRGGKFVEPKTTAGIRTIPLSRWLAEALRAQVKRVGGSGLVFPARSLRDDATPVCEQALKLYEQGIDRNEIARRFDSTPRRITQLICHERKRKARLVVEQQKADTTGFRFPQQPLMPQNFRRDVWIPLKAKAKVRNLDLYSLRHTFASMARASGEQAFNVSRALGQAKSLIVDTVYAHTMASGMEKISTSVTERVLGKPKLRVIPGGRRIAGGGK
jgi:integrase